jgi:hypothetical protein
MKKSEHVAGHDRLGSSRIRELSAPGMQNKEERWSEGTAVNFGII